jgi:hypothetical protein
MIVYPKLALTLTINTNDILSTNKEMMIRDNLQKFVHTNYQGYFILGINKVLEIGDRVIRIRGLDFSANVRCVVEFKARKLPPDDESYMAHNFVVKGFNKFMDGNAKEFYSVSASNADEHMYATISIAEPGVINLDMIIPIQVISTQYPQHNINSISIKGILIEPIFFNPINLFVADKNDDAKYGEMYDDYVDYVSGVKKLPRSEYFANLLYPYKKQKKNSSNISLHKALDNFSSCSIVMTDQHRISELEFTILPKKDNAPIEISFTTFMTQILSLGRRYWENVEQLSITYDSDEIFNNHKTLWKYFESKKL